MEISHRGKMTWWRRRRQPPTSLPRSYGESPAQTLPYMRKLQTSSQPKWNLPCQHLDLGFPASRLWKETADFVCLSSWPSMKHTNPVMTNTAAPLKHLITGPLHLFFFFLNWGILKYLFYYCFFLFSFGWSTWHAGILVPRSGIKNPRLLQWNTKF